MSFIHCDTIFCSKFGKFVFRVQDFTLTSKKNFTKIHLVLYKFWKWVIYGVLKYYKHILTEYFWKYSKSSNFTELYSHFILHSIIGEGGYNDFNYKTYKQSSKTIRTSLINQTLTKIEYRTQNLLQKTVYPPGRRCYKKIISTKWFTIISVSNPYFCRKCFPQMISGAKKIRVAEKKLTCIIFFLFSFLW